jgi:pimeloyl-ACP methyl ester carboxylesterase
MSLVEHPIAEQVPEEVANLAAQARRRETPCGEGVMVWRAWGEGPPLVLLHGANGSWTHWIRNIADLARERTVWAPDLPGFGESAAPPHKDDGASFAEALAGGLRELVGQDLPVDVVGFSFGGVLGGHLAVVAPEAVRRLILVDTGGIGTPMGHIVLQRIRGLEDEARRAAMRANLLTLMLHDPQSVDETALFIQSTVARMGRVNPGPLVLPDRFLDVLPHVPVQVDAIWGEWDRPHPDPPAQEAGLRRFQPDLDFRVVPNAGHWAMYEGAQAFNGILRALLDQPLRTARL